MCSGCAYKPGADANLEPYNAVKSLICALASIPFYCHHTRTGRDITALADKRFTKIELKELQMKICGGWSARTRVLEASGHYAGRRKTLQFIGHFAIESLDQMLDYTDKSANGEAVRREAEKQVWKALRLLSRKNKKKDALPGGGDLMVKLIEEHLAQADAQARVSKTGRWINQPQETTDV